MPITFYATVRHYIDYTGILTSTIYISWLYLFLEPLFRSPFNLTHAVDGLTNIRTPPCVALRLFELHIAITPQMHRPELRQR